jgi:hypothetical protein
VRGGGEARGRDDEVGQREERPDGGDDQDVHFRRRELVPLAGPPVRDCGGGRRLAGVCRFGYGWVEMLECSTTDFRGRNVEVRRRTV